MVLANTAALSTRPRHIPPAQTQQATRKLAGAPLRQIFTKGAPVVAALSAKTAVLLSLSYAAASTATPHVAAAATITCALAESWRTMSNR